MSINVYPSLQQRLSAIDVERLDLLSNNELIYALETIKVADELALTGIIGGAIDTLKAATVEPIFDGDLISSTIRNILIDKGLMVRTLYKCSDGYSAITLRGNDVLKLLQLYIK